MDVHLRRSHRAFSWTRSPVPLYRRAWTSRLGHGDWVRGHWVRGRLRNGFPSGDGDDPVSGSRLGDMLTRMRTLFAEVWVRFAVKVPSAVGGSDRAGAAGGNPKHIVHGISRLSFSILHETEALTCRHATMLSAVPPPDRR